MRNAKLRSEIIRSEKAIEFFKARPDIPDAPGFDDYKALVYIFYLGEKIRDNMSWNYAKLRELSESKETKARREIEKKKSVDALAYISNLYYQIIMHAIIEFNLILHSSKAILIKYTSYFVRT